MTVAISTGPETHLDHLAPLCALLEIPLIVTTKEHLEMGKHFYPMVDFEYLSLEELSLEYIANRFKTILACGKFWALELKPLLKLLFNKEVRFVLVPHGYSDKEEMLNSPVSQDLQLCYGPDQEGVPMGNLRHWFYTQHKDHFDRLAAPYFNSEKRVVLYAPTWETKATPTSFFDKMDEVVSSFSKEYHLLVKLHPLLEENRPAHYFQILGKYESSVTFIEKFPLIYPLLERTAIYLGDFSSVGYDFLTYNRPMYFLKEGGKLQKCGTLLNGSIEDRQVDLEGIRKKMYVETFGKVSSYENLKTLLQRL